LDSLFVRVFCPLDQIIARRKKQIFFVSLQRTTTGPAPREKFQPTWMEKFRAGKQGAVESEARRKKLIQLQPGSRKSVGVPSSRSSDLDRQGHCFTGPRGRTLWSFGRGLSFSWPEFWQRRQGGARPVPRKRGQKTRGKMDKTAPGCLLSPVCFFLAPKTWQRAAGAYGSEGTKGGAEAGKDHWTAKMPPRAKSMPPGSSKKRCHGRAPR